MINSVNSYSGYNYLSALNNENSKTKNTDEKLNNIDKNTNLNQTNSTNISNQINHNTILSSNQTNNTKDINNTSNLVSDKSQAISQILGYGVDKEGFFTSDFNEAAGLPSDYRIYANLINEMDKTLTTPELTSKSLYYSVDWAKELGNFYRENLQSFDSFGQNFNKEQIEKEFELSLNDDFTKESVLISIFMNDDWTKIKEGESTLFGKTYGFDENINKKDMKEFYVFMQKNQLKDPNNIEKSSFKNIISDAWMGIDREKAKLHRFISYSMDFKLGSDIIQKAVDFENEFDKLMSGNLSLDEFKAKYLDFKQRHDEFVKEFEFAMGDNLMVKPIDEKTFKPIQGESKNKETYKDTDNELLKKLLENKFDEKQLLEILFGIKSSNDDINNDNFRKLISQMNSNNIKSIDIKA